MASMHRVWHCVGSRARHRAFNCLPHGMFLLADPCDDPAPPDRAHARVPSVSASRSLASLSSIRSIQDSSTSACGGQGGARSWGWQGRPGRRASLEKAKKTGQLIPDNGKNSTTCLLHLEGKTTCSCHVRGRKQRRTTRVVKTLLGVKQQTYLEHVQG